MDFFDTDSSGAGDDDSLFPRAWVAVSANRADALEALLALKPELAREGGTPSGEGIMDLARRARAALAGSPSAISGLSRPRAKSLLHRACETGALDCALALLEGGADATVQCLSGKRATSPLLDLFSWSAHADPLTAAQAKKTLRVARFLSLRGAAFPYGDYDAWMLARLLAKAGRDSLAQECVRLAAFDPADAGCVERAALALSLGPASGLAATRFLLGSTNALGLVLTAKIEDKGLLEAACLNAAFGGEASAALDALLAAGASMDGLPEGFSAQLRARGDHFEPVARWLELQEARKEAAVLREALPADGQKGASGARPARGRL